MEKWVHDLLRKRPGRLNSGPLTLPPGAVDCSEHPHGQLVSPTHQSMVLTHAFWVANQLSKVNPPLVVDVGCGTGDLVRDLSQFRSQPQYLGLDVRVDFKPVQSERVQFLQCDFVQVWPLRPDSVPCMVASEVLEHMPQLESELLLGAMVESLEPGGHLLLTLPVNRPSISREEDARKFGHYHWWDARLLVDFLGEFGDCRWWSSIAPRDTTHNDRWFTKRCEEVLGTAVPYLGLRERYAPYVAKQLLSWLIPIEDSNHLQVHFVKES